MLYSSLHYLGGGGPKGKTLWYIINTVVVAPFRLPSLVAQIKKNFCKVIFYSKVVAYAINGNV